MNQIDLKQFRFGTQGTNGCDYHHLPDYNSLYQVSYGNLTTAELIEMTTQGLEYMKVLGTTGYVTDARKFGVLSAEADQWLQSVWFPQVISTTQLKKVAVILPEDVFGKMSVSDIMDNLDSQLEETPAFQMKHFGQLEDALAWVKS